MYHNIAATADIRENCHDLFETLRLLAVGEKRQGILYDLVVVGASVRCIAHVDSHGVEQRTSGSGVVVSYDTDRLLCHVGTFYESLLPCGNECKSGMRAVFNPLR